MDVTGGLADKLPGILNPAIEKLLTALTGAESKVDHIEQTALDAFHSEVAAGLQAATVDIPNRIEAILKDRLAPVVLEWKRTNDILERIKLAP